MTTPRPDRPRSLRVVAMGLGASAVALILLGIVALARGAPTMVGELLLLVGVADGILAFLFTRRSSDLS